MRKLRTAAASACLAFLLAGCGGGGEDPPPPVVLADRAPLSGAVDATETYVMVRFSEPMDPASLAAGISVSRVGGGAVAGAVSASGDLAYFVPLAPFPAATTLQATVSAEVRSAAGARLGAPATWSFTTAHWRPMSATDAPTARSGHTAVWTGSEMIVCVSGTKVATGGAYEPATDSWRTISATNAPTARSGHSAVWTGTEMIVWGGAGKDLSGGRYDPATDTWTPTSLTNAPAIDSDHRALWTGSRMAVWGGSYCDVVAGGGGVVSPVCLGIPPVRIGGLYDPVGDTWTPTTTTLAPAARALHVLAWSGSELLVWGGVASSSGLSSGGRYTPASDSWIPTSEARAPAARVSAHSAWTGSRLLVWSGISTGTFGAVLSDGALFDPATDVWTPVSTAGSSAALQRGAASVWTGSELVVWGGDGAATGARFTP